ncbi:coiled-coil domain-containing protein [Weissella confusa]|uniref:hypothetical protein n=1 Tax=Weissella confusa TaxID=1583 RepID=UPI0018990C3A|nr:hypothetical protein [Weissella confusa]
MKAISDYKKPLFVVSVVLIALAILNTAFDYGQQLIITAASSALGVILLMAVTYVVVTEFKANWDAKFSELMATQDSIQEKQDADTQATAEKIVNLSSEVDEKISQVDKNVTQEVQTNFSTLTEQNKVTTKELNSEITNLRKYVDERSNQSVKMIETLNSENHKEFTKLEAVTNQLSNQIDGNAEKAEKRFREQMDKQAERADELERGMSDIQKNVDAQVQNVLNKLRDSQDKINNALSEQKEDILNHVHDVNENLGNALWKANASLAEQMTNQNDSLISNDDGIKALILEGQTKASENNTAQLNRIDSLSESVSGFENGMQAVMKAHDETQKSEFNETRQSIDSVKQQMQVNFEGQADQFNADLQGVADALDATTNQNHESVMSHLGLITGDVKNVNDQVLTNEKTFAAWNELAKTRFDDVLAEVSSVGEKTQEANKSIESFRENVADNNRENAMLLSDLKTNVLEGVSDNTDTLKKSLENARNAQLESIDGLSNKMTSDYRKVEQAVSALKTNVLDGVSDSADAMKDSIENAQILQLDALNELSDKMVAGSQNIEQALNTKIDQQSEQLTTAVEQGSGSATDEIKAAQLAISGLELAIDKQVNDIQQLIEMSDKTMLESNKEILAEVKNNHTEEIEDLSDLAEFSEMIQTDVYRGVRNLHRLETRLNDSIEIMANGFNDFAYGNADKLEDIEQMQKLSKQTNEKLQKRIDVIDQRLVDATADIQVITQKLMRVAQTDTNKTEESVHATSNVTVDKLEQLGLRKVSGGQAKRVKDNDLDVMQFMVLKVN